MSPPQDEPAKGLADEWPGHLPAPRTATRLDDGWVGQTWVVTLDDARQVVVKRSPHPAAAEADGLAALRAARVPVPEVLGVHGHTLVLARIVAQGPPPDDADWSTLGRAVAGMHQVTFDRFGWHRDNHAGRFPQPNPWTADWPTFFAEHRVRVHLDDPMIPAPLRRRLERACGGPIQQRLRPDPPASLTHGDLWMGNTIAGRWIVDPEVSAADHELDLAYMQMSTRRPFPAAFWRGYREVADLPPGFPERRPVLQLHHRLLQLRHFGAGQLPPLRRTLDDLGW